MTEKIELALERRQVAMLAACALVLLGGVFALGVLVGRQLASAPLAGPQKAAPGDLTALDAQRDELVAPPAKPETIVPAQRTGGATSPIAPVVLANSAHAASGPVSPDEVDDDADVPEDAAGKKAAQALAAAKGVMVVPAPVVARMPAPGASAKIASTLPLGPPPKDLGAFTVQLGASQNRGDAQRLEARGQAAGLRPYLIEANLGAKGVWYRVRVGAFATRDAAERFRKDAERELGGNAVVMQSRGQ